MKLEVVSVQGCAMTRRQRNELVEARADLIEALNVAPSQLGERFGAQIARGFAAFEAASADADGNTCAAGLRIKLPAGGCNAHPSTLGHDVLASAIVVVVR